MTATTAVPRRPISIAVTSGKGGVGKTSVAVNLAVALARLRNRVAILDADFGLGNVDVMMGLAPPAHVGHVLVGEKTLREVLVTGPCGVQVGAKAYAMNATVVTPGPLGYLTLWPTGATQPFGSTLNSPEASVVSNAAIVQAGADGSISAFATNALDLILDVSGYFAP